MDHDEALKRQTKIKRLERDNHDLRKNNRVLDQEIERLKAKLNSYERIFGKLKNGV